MTAINEVGDLTIEGDVAVLTLNSPPVNALSAPVRTAIADGIKQALDNAAVKAVVLICEGKTFIAGADITEFGKAPKGPSLFDALSMIENASKPVVAAIHGTALGGGLEVALTCHYRVAVPSAKCGLPEVNLGLLPGAGGTQRLPRIVGPAKAMEIMFAGDPVDAAEAHRIGLINRLVPRGQALAEAKKMVKVYEDRAPLSLAWIKRSVHRGTQMDLASALEFETFLVSTIYQTADRKEGIGAFLAKRKAKFTGQ